MYLKQGNIVRIISALPISSQVTFYLLLAFIGLFTLLIFVWQILVLKGRGMPNPDGSMDDWHEQKIFFGIAFADVFLACPFSFAGIVMIFTGNRIGFFLVSLVSFWLLWANLMNTVTSLRFEKPKINLNWLFVFPTGIFVGAGYLVWIAVHSEQVFR